MMDSVAKTIIDNYDAYDESQRLKSPYGVLEEAHTRKLIGRYVDPASAEIYDIGGGTGPYSSWLARMGHNVHLSDIVPKHVDAAKKENRDGLIKTIREEDARKLTYCDGCADLIIMNGPLYHLVERNDRKRAIAEAKRILKPNGIAMFFGINRLSGLKFAINAGEISMMIIMKWRKMK